VLNVGSPGIGTPPHLAAEAFRRAAGIEVQHVPYNGGGALSSALLAGQVQFAVEGITTLGPQVKAGRLRALALTSPARVAAWPEVPTMAEAGLPAAEFRGWVGVAGPARMPPAIVDRLYREIVAISASPEGRDWFAQAGAEPGGIPPDRFAAEVRAEHARWGAVIREAGIRIE